MFGLILISHHFLGHWWALGTSAGRGGEEGGEGCHWCGYCCLAPQRYPAVQTYFLLGDFTLAADTGDMGHFGITYLEMLILF